MVGAYATALLAPHGGWAAAMLGAAALGAGLREVLGLGLLSIRLDGDYLAIVTLGFGEVMRLLLLSESWLREVHVDPVRPGLQRHRLGDAPQAPV